MICTIAEGKKLDKKYRDHRLSGDYTGCRECHVEPDWLLIYEVMNNVLVLMKVQVVKAMEPGRGEVCCQVKSAARQNIRVILRRGRYAETVYLKENIMKEIEICI